MSNERVWFVHKDNQFVEYEDLDELLDDNPDLGPKSPVLTGEKSYYRYPSSRDLASNVLEYIYDDIDDCTSPSEGIEVCISAQHHAELETYLYNWLKELPPTGAYAIVNQDTHTITEEEYKRWVGNRLSMFCTKTGKRIK